MKTNPTTREMAGNSQIITLEGYYNKLPDVSVSAPKKAFVERVAQKCNVKPATVRAWIKRRRAPSNPQHLIVLSEESGIPIENLWNHEAN